MDQVDVAIVGAGIIGASIAYHVLAERPSWRAVVLESADAPGIGETRWATGGVRHQFGTEANVRLSQLSLPTLERFAEQFGIDPEFRRHGYLFVTAQPSMMEALERQRALQNDLGVPTELVSPRRAAELCPPLRIDDLVGGTFCALDGSIDPHWMLQGFLDAFRRAGGDVRLGAAVTALERRGVAGWRIETAQGELGARAVVIAAGPQSRQVAALAQLDVPAHPFRRQVFVALRPESVPDGIPLTVDMDTGWYAHAHHAELLLGGTDKDNRPGLDPEVDWALFDAVYDAATRRMPTLAEAKIVRAYAGVRTLTPDHHAILGPVEGHEGLYLACGLSGHGIMHSPAVGMLLAAWITGKGVPDWVSPRLTYDRFRHHTLAHETAVF